MTIFYTRIKFSLPLLKLNEHDQWGIQADWLLDEQEVDAAFSKKLIFSHE